MEKEIKNKSSELIMLTEKAEQEMAARFGMLLYKSETGFTQDQIYTYGGRYDSVFNIMLKPGSDSFHKYGEMITLCFVYSQKERNAMETNVYALNEKPLANAKLLDFEHEQEASDTLLKDGVNPRDIVSMVVLPSTKENNTFPSKEKRKPDVLEIPFEVEGNGRDIQWMYGFLKRLKTKGVGIMPEDEAQYLAYKLVLEKDGLTEEERNAIFDDKGRICNNAVSYHYLLWRADAGFLTDKQKEQLNILQRNRYLERVSMLNKSLDEIGLKVEKFVSKYPKQAAFLCEKIISFHDKSFNTTGRFPLYMNFNSFLHIYFRHVEELNISSQFAGRDKFQLEEKDIMTVISIVMNDLNDTYQAYKEENPEKEFHRTGEMAYYYNGDYYNVVVNPDGSISTFYKGTGKK